MYKYINTMITQTLIPLFLFAYSLKAELLLFDRGISERIFTHHEIILIYVEGQQRPEVRQIVEKACEQAIDCCRLNEESPYYDQITDFIGYHSDSIMAIIDADDRLKYVLPLDSDFSQLKILKFRSQYQAKELSPYFASQQKPKELQHGQSCLKVVGLNYQDFLSEEQPIKIVFLYSSDQICQNCQKLLRKYCQLASKHDEKGTLIFGYFDVSKNDNIFIRDEIFPYFLIYVFDNFEDPYGVDADEFQELEGYVGQLKKDVGKAVQQEKDEFEERQSQKDELEEL